jgi:murein DD-endopeptidase MepM/ murein hydrolase activator NlpD
LVRPGRLPRVFGPVTGVRARTLHAGSLVYPADGSIAEAKSVALRSTGCAGRGSRDGTAVLRSLSLFSGLVKAQSVELAVQQDKTSSASSIKGLTVDGRPVTPKPARRIAIGDWAYLVVLPPPSTSPTLVGIPRLAAREILGGALAVHVLRAHSGLPAGVVLLVSFARLPPTEVSGRTVTRAAQRRHRHGTTLGLGLPLTVTPPLGLRHYVFPVAGAAEYIDTYGAFRSDVPGNWHHGDDIFAPLGAPVVAVASGSLNRVGWERLGGWRLWVRDSAGDEFYYAHLSGYSPRALHTRRVRAGEVIGFVGNSGDAFTTSPHVHFEIHPRSLLRLGYDGAVDPTTYLNKWHHLASPVLPKPVHPPFPAGPIRKEALFIWRELLAARHLIPHAPPARERPHVALPGRNFALPNLNVSSVTATPPPTDNASRRSDSTRLLVLLLALLGPVLLAGSILIRHRNQRPTGTVADLDSIED